jgi:hypothetical protein
MSFTTAIFPLFRRRHKWHTGLPTVPHALALHMGQRAAPWITLHPQSLT